MNYKLLYLLRSEWEDFRERFNAAAGDDLNDTVMQKIIKDLQKEFEMMCDKLWNDLEQDCDDFEEDSHESET